jgi:hypothetical protein
LRLTASTPPGAKLRLPVLIKATPDPPGARVPLTATGTVADPLVFASVPPAATVTPLVPVRLPPRFRVPPDTVVAPVYVCACERVSVPPPALTTAWLPLITPSYVEFASWESVTPADPWAMFADPLSGPFTVMAPVPEPPTCAPRTTPPAPDSVTDPPLALASAAGIVSAPAEVDRLTLGAAVCPLTVAVTVAVTLIAAVPVMFTLPSLLATTTFPPATLIGTAAVPTAFAAVVPVSVIPAVRAMVPVGPASRTLSGPAMAMLPASAAIPFGMALTMIRAPFPAVMLPRVTADGVPWSPEMSR